MFDRLSERARRVMGHARVEAVGREEDYIGTEHLLLGLIREEEGTAASALVTLGVRLEELREALGGGPAAGSPEIRPSQLPFTPRAKRCLERALEEARRLRHDRIGTGHLLLGLIRVPDGNAAPVLARFGVRLEDARIEVEEAEPAGPRPEKAPRGAPKRPPATGEKARSTLETYGVPLEVVHRSGGLGPVVGREAEIRRMVEILLQRRRNNVVLVGRPGVGRTTLVHGLTREIVEGRVPDRLYGLRVIALDLVRTIAGTTYRGQFEERLTGLFAEAKSAGNVILVFDEVETLLGAGLTVNGGIDAAVILKQRIESTGIRCIFVATPRQYRRLLRDYDGFDVLLKEVRVEPPGPEETLAILREVAPEYGRHHGVSYADEALAAAVALSDLYLPDPCQPAKALDLIDDAGAGAFAWGTDSREAEEEVLDEEAIVRAVSRLTGIPAESIRRREDLPPARAGEEE
jgi:ATP-dependent Clp protease ATP-binding subunit ClpC